MINQKSNIIFHIFGKYSNLKLCLIILCLQGSNVLFSQLTIPPEYQVKAVFLYNFSHFIDWQNSLSSNPNDAFIIGILGNDPFGSYMDEIVRGEKVYGHPIIIQRYSDVRDIKLCHILFLNIKDRGKVKEVVTSLQGKNILTVSDISNFALDGGIIQFYTMKNKTRLRINIAAAKNAGLNISSKLLRVAETLNSNSF